MTYDNNYNLYFPHYVYQVLNGIYSEINQIKNIDPFFVNNNPFISQVLWDIYSGFEQIQRGLSIEYASTGKLICELNGIARLLAQLKNIGGNVYNGLAILFNTWNKITRIKSYVSGYLNGLGYHNMPFGLSY